MIPMTTGFESDQTLPQEFGVAEIKTLGTPHRAAQEFPSGLRKWPLPSQPTIKMKTSGDGL